MGLGKTIQILALLVSLKEARKTPHRPSLLVLPSSLLANWRSELQRFAPTLNAHYIHPSQLAAHDLAKLAADPARATSNADLVFTTYGMLSRQPWLQDVHWRLVILDEAQSIKNPSAQQTRAVKKLKSETRIVLTGTPVENSLSDLWSLFDFLMPGLLGTTDKFKKFIASLNQQEHQRYAPLRNLVAPYILRRLKTDKKIITDLPDKTEMPVFCGLTKKQAALYAKSVEELKYKLETADGIKRRGLVLAFILRFKQICNHPSQLLGDGVYDSTDSGKFDRLKSIAEEIASRQEKMLVFTQFREITDHIASFLSEIFGRSGLVLHGGTSVSKRQTMVDTFQKVEGPPFMVLTVKAGGTGLNLTQASHVVHFDRWWNPAVENQASDRAYRIGQHRNVLIHKFICQGTIEEKIDRMISDKKELAEGILTGAGAESLLTEMSDKELLDIVSLDLDRVSISE
jgi:SNF2 family DNA or RNA helicase